MKQKGGHAKSMHVGNQASPRILLIDVDHVFNSACGRGVGDVGRSGAEAHLDSGQMLPDVFLFFFFLRKAL